MHSLERQCRSFEPVVLGAEGPDPHPELAAILLSVRSDKALRRLAKSATYQLRHLCDVAAFESYLSRAAIASVERGIDPAAWLEANLRGVKLEQAATREEHARMAARIEGLTNKGGHGQTKAYISGQSHAGGAVFNRGVLP